MTTSVITPEMSSLKTRLKSTWESGDYGHFSKYLEKGALEFFNRLNLKPGTKLLDIACGAGQLTIPAARKGIDVTGLDLASNLVAQAKAKATAAGLDIKIMQGDAEDLPFADNAFDTTLSLIGAMFAPRPDLVAAEMVRTCKPAGKVIMGNWTPEGFVGQMFKVVGKFAPPPAIMPSPLLWGNENVCRERFGHAIKDLKITRHLYPLEYPFGPAKVADFFFEFYGPTNRAMAAQTDDSKKKAFREEMADLWSHHNKASGDQTQVLGEYLEVIGIKA